MKFLWENIYKDDKCYTFRARVFGGWLIINESTNICETHISSQSMTFIKDPKHEWSTDT